MQIITPTVVQMEGGGGGGENVEFWSHQFVIDLSKFSRENEQLLKLSASYDKFYFQNFQNKRNWEEGDNQPPPSLKSGKWFKCFDVINDPLSFTIKGNDPDQTITHWILDGTDSDVR